jgi:hypothetical protein
MFCHRIQLHQALGCADVIRASLEVDCLFRFQNRDVLWPCVGNVDRELDARIREPEERLGPQRREFAPLEAPIRDPDMSSPMETLMVPSR